MLLRGLVIIKARCGVDPCKDSMDQSIWLLGARKQTPI